MLVNLIFAAILTFLVFCCICAIANVFADSKRPLVSLEDKKHHFHTQIFYFVVFVVLAVMIGVLALYVVPVFFCYSYENNRSVSCRSYIHCLDGY